MVERIGVLCAASLERYREKKATRQCGSSKIRYQIRKTNADNRPRFKVGLLRSSALNPNILNPKCRVCRGLYCSCMYAWMNFVLFCSLKTAPGSSSRNCNVTSRVY